MGGLDRRIGKRQRHHARGHLRTERRDARGPRLVVQEAGDAFLSPPAKRVSARRYGPWSSRPRTDRVIVMEIPVRMHQLARQPKQRTPNQDSRQAKTTRRRCIP